MANRNRIINITPLRYLSAGAFTAFTEYSIFALLFWLSGYALVSHAVSFIIAFHVSFASNRLWVFSEERAYAKSAIQQYASTALLAAANLGISSLVFMLLTAVLPAMIAKLITLAMIAVWTYLIMHRAIFRSIQR